jgi:hypothetical protein
MNTVRRGEHLYNETNADQLTELRDSLWAIIPRD